jgi:hypothetical protein
MAKGKKARKGTHVDRVVPPSAPNTEERRDFGSAVGWKKRQLDLLGVEFVKTSWDLNTVLGVQDSDWPAEIRTRTCPLSRLIV